MTDPTEEIKALKAKRDVLETQLARLHHVLETQPGMTEAREIAIRQQITAISGEITGIHNQIAAYINLLSRAGPASDRGGAYRIEVKFTNGAKYKDLRRLVYAHAQESVAFDGKIEYGPTPITSDSDLNVELFFQSESNARRFETELKHLHNKHSVALIYALTAVQHTCFRRVDEGDYDNSISPKRAASSQGSLDSASSGGTEVYTNRLTTEDVEQESVISPTFYTNGPKPEWAHIKERKECKQSEKEDSANRLVMDANLHQLYYGRGSGKTCEVSFYVEPSEPVEELPNKRTRVEVTVAFATSKAAQDHAPRLRSLTQFDSVKKTYKVCVYKFHPKAFIGYLNDRHNKNVMERGFPSGPATL